MIWLYIVLGAVLLLVLFIFIGYYNKFIIKGNRIDNSLAQIDVQLKKRADLVPNLIETVKGYAKHEKAIITEVTNARKAMLSAGNMNEKVKAGDQLQGALKSIFALGENYPQLRANENFLHLQQELSAIEDKVAYSRQFYNDSVLDLNNSMKVFPGVIFAKMYGVKKRDFLEATVEERKVVKVKF
jgi:LemA protein